MTLHSNKNEILKCFPESETEVYKKEDRNISYRFEQDLKVVPSNSDIISKKNIDQGASIIDHNQKRRGPSSKRMNEENSDVDERLTLPTSISRSEEKRSVKKKLARNQNGGSEISSEDFDEINECDDISKKNTDKISKKASKSDFFRLSKIFSKSGIFKVATKMSKLNLHKTSSVPSKASSSQIPPIAPSLFVNQLPETQSKFNIFPNADDLSVLDDSFKKMSETDFQETLEEGNELSLEQTTKERNREGLHKIAEEIASENLHLIGGTTEKMTMESLILREIHKKKKNVLDTNPEEFFLETWTDFI